VTDTDARRPLDARRLASWAGGILLGGVLLIAAWAKFLNPAAFAEQIEGLGLAFVLDARRLAWLGVAVEAGLGVALLLGLRSRWLLIFATALVLFFLLITGRTYVRELRGLPIEEASCGCFGSLIERTPAQAFWQDLFLLIPGLALCWLGRGKQGAASGLRWVAVGAVSLTAFVLSSRSLALPLDDLATQARPGAAIEELCAGNEARRVCLGQLAPALQTGRTWVVVGDIADDDFARRDTPALNAWIDGHPDQRLMVLVSATLDEQSRFFWKAAPAFELQDAPPALLKSFYRTLPRSFLVENGVIVETALGLPPTSRSKSSATT
jgi:uncharacterized membrane protein YphA (DoxX/SURF4 family)